MTRNHLNLFELLHNTEFSENMMKLHKKYEVSPDDDDKVTTRTAEQARG